MWLALLLALLQAGLKVMEILSRIPSPTELRRRAEQEARDDSAEFARAVVDRDTARVRVLIADLRQRVQQARHRRARERRDLPPPCQ